MKLKGFESLPTEKIEKLLSEAFKVNAKTLNDDNEISLLDFKTFCLTYDHSR